MKKIIAGILVVLCVVGIAGGYDMSVKNKANDHYRYVKETSPEVSCYVEKIGFGHYITYETIDEGPSMTIHFRGALSKAGE